MKNKVEFGTRFLKPHESSLGLSSKAFCLSQASLTRRGVPKSVQKTYISKRTFQKNNVFALLPHLESFGSLLGGFDAVLDPKRGPGIPIQIEKRVRFRVRFLNLLREASGATFGRLSPLWGGGWAGDFRSRGI